MHDYSTYDTTAFVVDPGFAAWVKYGEQHAFWTTFLQDHPHKREEVEQAGAIILAAASMPLHYPAEQERRRMWAQIAQALPATGGERQPAEAAPARIREMPAPAFTAPAPVPETLPGTPGKRRRYGWYAAAAAVLAGCLLAPRLWHRVEKHDNYAVLLRKAGLRADHRTEAQNDTQKPLWVSLPDGSSAVLAPGGRLSYADDFTTRPQREVYLSGAAFFEVDKRATHPFVVYAAALSIKVLGTSFSVSAPNDRPDVQVQVKSGKVLLFTGQESHSLVVNARQQAALTQGQLLLTVANTTEAPAPTPGTAAGALAAAEQIPLTFEDASIPDVFSALEEAYGITIDYDKTTLAHCRLTAFLSDEPLPEKIRLIAKAIQASYAINGSAVTIKAKRCN
ncbi:MAG TPA: FecR domain-containing protein [Chitinophaga sp.]